MTVASNTTQGGTNPEGLRQYYVAKIEKLQLTVTERNQNLRRLQAQRNELNAKVRMLSEELQLLVRALFYSSIFPSRNYVIFFLLNLILARTRLVCWRSC